MVTFDATEAQEIARALAAVAAADGAIKAREEIFLDGFACQHAVAGGVWIPAPLDEVALTRAIIDHEKRREVVRLCVTMAFADLSFTPEEATIIERIARALSVEAAEVKTLIEVEGARLGLAPRR